MELIKNIYKNNEKINELRATGNEANNELINLLLQKANKNNRYTIKIKTDRVKDEIKATLLFNQYNFDYEITAKYKYEFLFKNIDKMIEL